MGIFFRELHSLTRSGFPIAQACRELERRAPAHLRSLAREMGEAAQAGRPISDALRAHTDLLYPWHFGVIRAAEAGGFLPDALEQIAHAYEVEWETRSALLARLFFYVVFGLPPVLVALPVILALAEPIPPQGWNLGLFVDAVLRHARGVSLPIVVGLVTLVIVLQILGATTWFQRVQQSAVLRLPVVGQVARSSALERYLSILGLMLRGGVPVSQAAELAAFAAGNAVLTPRLLEVVPAVREGVPVSQALAICKLDPDTMSMMATGEVSGNLPDMLSRAAAFYRAENEAKRRMLLRLAGTAFGVLWLSLGGAVIVMFMRTYFDFAFRVYDWMLE